jgi:hypothetical protein
MDWELWGTFSVGDHLRRRAFVSDVLLYDRLVIPTPPESDVDEQDRWQKMGWRPARQRRLLGLLGRNRGIRVPWTEFHRQSWETRYREAREAQPGGVDPAVVRAEMAQAAADDVKRTLEARRDFDWEGYGNRGGRPEEIDELAHFTTRALLVDWSSMQNDSLLFMGLPPVQVDAVAAYGSYQAFTRDHHVGLVDAGSMPPDNLLNVFGWEFLVPSDPELSDEDLLKKALEIASLEETKSHRRAFHKWRRDVIVSGASPQEASEEMEEIIQDYRSAVRRSRIPTVAKHAFAVVSAAADIAALAFPPLAAGGIFATLGSYVVESVEGEVPENLKVAAMFHDARKRFGWYRRTQRRRQPGKRKLQP